MKICSPSVIAIVHLLIIQCVSNITSQLWLSCGSLEGFWPSKPMSLVAVGKVISGSECLQGTDTAIEEDGEGEGRRDEGEGIESQRRLWLQWTQYVKMSEVLEKETPTVVRLCHAEKVTGERDTEEEGDACWRKVDTGPPHSDKWAPLFSGSFFLCPRLKSKAVYHSFLVGRKLPTSNVGSKCLYAGWHTLYILSFYHSSILLNYCMIIIISL